MKKLLVLLAALALSACASTTDVAERIEGNDEFKALAALAVDDLKNAKELAESADDPIAAMCWGSLLKHAERAQALAAREKIGVAEKWQLVRNLRRGEDERDACSVLVDDARQSVLRLVTRLGSVAARL